MAQDRKGARAGRVGPTPPAGRRGILIVDDHPVVRRGLAQLIDQEPGLYCCGEASDASTALRQAVTLRPDLVLVDLSLQDGDGLDLIKRIRAAAPRVRLLVYSMHDESLYAERALRAGALGYVSKHSSTDELLAGIRAVLEGKIHLSPKMANRLLRRFQEPGDLPRGTPMEVITDRELQVLRLLGGGLGSREIADTLNLSVKTIETYREHLKRKLNLKSANELVRFAVAWTLESDQTLIRDPKR